MDVFPLPDPIPLPAPVWLLKGLHVLTLSLHFIAMELLVGGLLAAIGLSLISRRQDAHAAATAMARRLPVVMTYVINLGVPPLLFAQVLYGRALYTSSVLIGAWWISVIFLLMACYWLLYRFSGALEAGRAGWPSGLAAWFLAAVIAKIYTGNMTLMLRPEAWQEMYGRSAIGIFLPIGDPTVLPRWLLVFAGGLMIAGLWMLYLSGRSVFSGELQRFFSRTGGPVAGGAAILAALGGWFVFQAQPGAVQTALANHPVYGASAGAWAVAVALIAVAGLVAALKHSKWISSAAPVLAVLAMASLTVFRDGIRDLTLLGKGFDVWQRMVVPNWGVIALFLIVFMAGLGAVSWLVAVAVQAEKAKKTREARA